MVRKKCFVVSHLVVTLQGLVMSVLWQRLGQIVPFSPQTTVAVLPYTHTFPPPLLEKTDRRAVRGVSRRVSGSDHHRKPLHGGTRARDLGCCGGFIRCCFR